MDKALFKKLMKEGHALVERKHLDRASVKYKLACAANPDHAHAKAAYIYACQRIGKWESDIRFQASELKRLIRAGHDAPPFTCFCMFDEPDVVKLAAVHTAARLSKGKVQYTDWKLQDGRIRIGYMSSYFRKHALSVLIAEILKLHNREMFEIYIFAYGEAKEDTQERKRIMEYADHFINLRGTNDKDSAVLIRDLGINILFDMNGYSGNIRPGILALRPAPVQALWMSYPNTVGGPYTDYYISDRYIVETEEHAKSFTEKVKRLSRCCWTYDTESRIPDYSITRETEGLPKDAIVLGNFNGVHKMSFLTISLWMEILQKTDNTLLWTMESNHLMRPAMQELAKKYGVDPKRILPAAIVPHAKHLGRFQAVDLVLDTFPCNGHTLTMDALWAGCPVVTYAGRTPVGRVAGSALRTQGFDQLVAQSPQEYVSTAVEICKNPDLRQYIRTEMMERRYSGTLFDQKSFVRELDSIYMEIWQEAKQELNL